MYINAQVYPGAQLWVACVLIFTCCARVGGGGGGGAGGKDNLPRTQLRRVFSRARTSGRSHFLLVRVSYIYHVGMHQYVGINIGNAVLRYELL